MRKPMLLLLSAVGLVPLVLHAAPAHAAVFMVDSTNDAPDIGPGDGTCATVDGVCTLRAAVMEANALVALGAKPPNRILVGAGIYTLTIAGRGEDGAATGDLDVNGGALTIMGIGSGEVILDANGLDRAFHLGPVTPTDFSLEGFMIRNGNAVSTPPNPSATGPDVGGAIRVEKNSGLQVRNATFSNNHAGARGGAIGMPTTAGTSAGADPNIITDLFGVTLEHNSAGVEAGGFFSNRGAILRRVNVLNNRVTGGVLPLAQQGTERGGGIANSGDITLTDVVIDGNTMGSGNGGGISNRGDPVALIFGTIRLSNVTVSNNQAEAGGGIANGNGATAFLTNVTISGNRATDQPGIGLPPAQVFAGGFGNLGTATLTNVTLSGNSAPLGGGILTLGPPFGAPTASTTLRNSIVARGPVGGNCVLPPIPIPIARAPSSGGDNISSDLTCALAGPGDLNGIDPMLGPLDDNGGFTPTHALLPGSLAIDGVFNNVCPPPATDQRGVPRPQGPRCDIGAFERDQ